MPDGYPNVPRDRMPVSIDFYNNDMTNMRDNCIEGDGAMHNVRVLRNRCLNTGLEPLSGQPILGGPAYYIRNITYHSPLVGGREGGAFKSYYSEPAGLVILQNTLCVELALKVGPYPTQNGMVNVHARNNLVLGESVFPQIFQVGTYTNYTSSDFNGFRPNPGAEYSFTWTSPPFDILYGTHENPQWVRRDFKTLAEYQQGTGQDEHSVLVDYDIFQNVAQADLNDPQRLYKAQDLDFGLKPGSVAVDKGCILPNVNDDFTGNAPDLGALEVGKPVPIYGPRP
jgi:hypothetical protein